MTECLSIPCPHCGFANVFAQPYRYHAGFGDTAFLYNEGGNCTLMWGVYDEFYDRLLDGDNAWRPSLARQRELEDRLPLSPAGDRCYLLRRRVAALAQHPFPHRWLPVRSITWNTPAASCLAAPDFQVILRAF